MSALRTLATVEAKLLLRDPTAVILVVAIPAAILLIFGLLPGANEVSAELGGQSLLSGFIAPLAVVMPVVILGLATVPGLLALYREKGVLRRMQASPVPPSTLLVAQLSVQLVAVVVVVALVMAVGMPTLRIDPPGNLFALIVAFLLGTTALFAVGLLIGAIAPSGTAANGIGTAVMFPMLALGGIWVPAESLPAVLRWASDVLPLGALFNALRAAWSGDWPGWLQLGSLAVFAVSCLAVAAKTLRWQ